LTVVDSAKVLCLLTAYEARYRQLDGQTHRQTDENAISIAERFLYETLAIKDR